MLSIRLLAAAALAASGLTLASAAGAAPQRGAVASPWSAEIIQIQHGSRDDWRRRDEPRDRRGDWGDRRGGREEWRDGDRHRRHERHERRERHSDRHYRHDDRRYSYGERHYRYGERHYHGWWDHGRWRAKHHPRHTYWIGRPLPRDRYVVIYDYDAYYLPRPRPGYFYARIDNDVYLVAAATRSIIDAFLLIDAIGR